MKLTSKTIMITGGTSGIGYALAQFLLKQNNEVIILGSNVEVLDRAKDQGFGTIQCDLTDRCDIEKAVVHIQNEYQDLSVLFNNAGIQQNYLFDDAVMPLDKIAHEINVNITGQITITQLLLPILQTAKESMIVNTTSALGAFPKQNALVYSASKAAMRNFTKGLRFALNKSDIKVIEFIPPVTDTNMTKGRPEKKMPLGQLLKEILPQIENGKSLATTSKVRLFLFISFLSEALAHKIINK